MRRRMISLIVLAVALILVVALLFVGMRSVRDLSASASEGKARAAAGARELASMNATAAAGDFDAALASFNHAQGILGPEWLDGTVGAIPWAGRQYLAARALLTIGLDGSTAGAEMATALRTAQAASAGSGGGKLSKVFVEGRPHIEAALAALADAASGSAALDSTGLVPPLASAVNSLKSSLASATPLLHRARALLDLERYLFAERRRILVVSQDGAEIRPTGGFAGSFGLIGTGPDGVQLETYRDSYSVPDPRTVVPAPPGMTFIRRLTFRDANWWIDYPTSARAMLALWRDAGEPPVDGVVVMDTVAMKDLLQVLGPMKVPGYPDTFTADNLLERVLYYTEGPGRRIQNRLVGNKGVLAGLASELEQRVLGLDPQHLGEAGMALAKAADQKHLQLYFDDPKAEAAVAAFGWSGAVSLPRGATDLLAVSNAMVAGGKVNTAVDKTMKYSVALRTDGSADTTIVLGYSYTGKLAFPVASTYQDLVRVYRAPGTVIAPAPLSLVATETGLPTYYHVLKLTRGESSVETVVSRVPAAFRSSALAAASEGGSRAGGDTGTAAYYRLLLVRQADLHEVPTTIQISPPAGWRVSSATGMLVASRTSVPTTLAGGSARLSMSLKGDVMLDVLLTR